MRELAADNADGVKKREPVWILVGLQRRFMHQTSDGKMRHQEPVEFLLNQLRGLAAENDPGSPQVGL